MKSKKLLEAVSELKESFLLYLETKISYYGITAFEKLAKIINYLVSHSIVMGVFLLSLIFLSGAAALYIGKLLQSYELGLLIVGGAYFLLGIILHLFRNKIFGRCVIRTLIKTLLQEEEEE